jgi:transcriptional regulator with XRE-family HTH domain
MNKFRERFTELLQEQNKTQKQIAREIGKTPQVISNWKVGFNEPNIDDLIKLANYFEVSIDYLVGRQDY